MEVKRWKLWLAGIAVLLVLIVVLQNTETVETQLLFVKVSMPRALLLGITLLVGFLIGIATLGRFGKKSDKKAKAGVQAPS